MIKELGVLIPVMIALTEFVKKRTGVKGPLLLVISWIIAIVVSMGNQIVQDGNPVEGILPGILAGLVANGSADFLKRLMPKG